MEDITQSSITQNSTTDEAYGADGSLLARYTGDSNSRSFVPFNGRLLAEYYCGGMIFDHPDEIGSLTTATDCAGNLVQERLYLPFGEFWTGTGNPGMHQEFAQLPDYDPETDQYNTANRHYSPSGRWLSPDPHNAGADPSDPQTWNMYAYVRNNPTTFVDPEGESIELTCSSQAADECAAERQKEIAALQNAVGAEAGKYLYDNVDNNGNHYVGIYTNGPNGNGPSFGSLGDAASALGGIINDQRVAQLDVVPAGTVVTDAPTGWSMTIGTVNEETHTTPGATYADASGQQHVAVLDWTKTQLGSLPGADMEDSQPGFLNPGIVVMHELGHVQSAWGTGKYSNTLINSYMLENTVRKWMDPKAPIRSRHGDNDYGIP